MRSCFFPHIYFHKAFHPTSTLRFQQKFLRCFTIGVLEIPSSNISSNAALQNKWGPKFKTAPYLFHFRGGSLNCHKKYF